MAGERDEERDPQDRGPAFDANSGAQERSDRQRMVVNVVEAVPASFDS